MVKHPVKLFKLTVRSDAREVSKRSEKLSWGELVLSAHFFSLVGREDQAVGLIEVLEESLELSSHLYNYLLMIHLFR